MKFIKVLLKLLGILIIVYLISAFMAKSSYRVERSAVVNAPLTIVYNQLGMLRNWESWSPWKEKDSTLINTYHGIDGQPGAKVVWKGDENLSGTGEIEFSSVNPPYDINYYLTFTSSPEMKSFGSFQLREQSSDKTRVSWLNSGDIPFSFRPMMMFFDMESLMGSDFERGLAKLDSVCSLQYKEFMESQVEDTTRTE